MSTEHKIGVKFGVEGLENVQVGISSLTSKIKSFTGLASKMTLGLTGIGGALTAGGFLAGIKNIADVGGGLSDLSARTDMTAGEIQILSLALANAGVEAGAIGQSIAYLNRAIASARDGNKEMVSTFDKLGLTWEQLYDMRPADRFRAVSESISALKNSVDRSDVAMRIFSRSGQQLLSLFRDPNAFKNAERMLGGMPVIMDKSAATFDKISDSIGGMSIKSQQFFAGFLSQIDESLASMLYNLDGLDLTGFGMKVGLKFQDAFTKFANGDIFGGMLSGLGTLYSGFKSLFEDVTLIANAAIKDISAAPLIDSIKTAFADVIIDFGSLFWNSFFDIGKNIAENYNIAVQRENAVIRLKQAQERLKWAKENEAYDKKQLDKANPDSFFVKRRLKKNADEVAAAKKGVLLAENDLVQGDQWDLDEEAREKERIKSLLAPGTYIGNFQNLQAAAAELQSKYNIKTYAAAPTEAKENTVSSIYRPGSFLAAVNGSAEADRLQSITDNEQAIKRGKKLIDALKEQSYGYDIQAEELESMRSLVDMNYKLLDVDKYEQRAGIIADMNKLSDDQIESIRSQNSEIENQINLLKTSLELMTEEERLKRESSVQSQILSLERDRASNERRITRLGSKKEMIPMSIGPDPDSYSDQINKATKAYIDGFGTMAMQVGGIVTTMSNDITNGLGNALTNVILQTKTVEEAFEEMGIMLLNSITSAIMGIVAQLVVAASIIAPLNFLTGGALGGMMKIMSFGLFASGGRVKGGAQIIGVNEEGSEFVVSARSPRTNDKWLEMANMGVEIDSAIRSMNNREFSTQPMTSGGRSGKQVTKQITVRTASQLRDEWKRGGIIEMVREGFMKRGWA